MEKKFYSKKDGSEKKKIKTLAELLEEEKNNLKLLEIKLEDLIKVFINTSIEPGEIKEKNIPVDAKELRDKIGRIWGGISYWKARQYLENKLVNEMFSKSKRQQRIAQRVIDLLF